MKTRVFKGKAIHRGLSVCMAFLLILGSGMFGGMTVQAAESVKTGTYFYESNNGVFRFECENYVGETGVVSIPGKIDGAFSIYYLDNESDELSGKLYVQNTETASYTLTSFDGDIYDLLLDNPIESFNAISLSTGSDGVYGYVSMRKNLQYNRIYFPMVKSDGTQGRAWYETWHIVLTPSSADKYLETGKLEIIHNYFDGPEEKIAVKSMEIPGLKELILTARGSATISEPSSWAKEQVQRANELKIVPENLNTAYTQQTTRSEFCALAVKLYETVKGVEITERKTFVDTTDVNVQKMGALGVVSGVGNDRFDPNGTLTREQAAVMLAKLAEVIGKPIPRVDPTFADRKSISSWAFAAVGQVQTAGIMSGVGNNTFAPKDSYTREQSIATILRLYDFVNNANNTVKNTGEWREIAKEKIKNWKYLGDSFNYTAGDTRTFIFVLIIRNETHGSSLTPMGEPMVVLTTYSGRVSSTWVSDPFILTVNNDGTIKPLTDAEIETFLNSYKR